MKYLLGCIASCCITFTAAQAQHQINIIPKPASITTQAGWYHISTHTSINYSPAFKEVATLLSESTGLKTTATNKDRPSPKGYISIVQAAVPATAQTPFAKDGYQLFITTDRVVISATTVPGALNGMQSLLQLKMQYKDSLPCAEITDYPRFGYRGMHLDVSRNFFPLSFVKRYIDLMAMYKMNVFHWHLTDGAGWRLEIKRYPELTAQAAWRTHNTWKEWWTNGRRYMKAGEPNAYGGYYTQQEARELVAYAKRRGITVIPEIEMPGHSEEVLAVYPALSCSGEPYKNAEYCIGNDDTFSFLENVLTEVMAIFPAEYIHIGGDEADKKAWKQCPKCQRRIKENHLKDEHELQSYAIRRMEQFLLRHNRRLLGWDEILEGGLAPQATVMSWRGESGGIAAAKEGHDVIMTPGAYCYFDSYQADPATQPETIGGFLPLQKVYAYEPVPPALDSSAARHILGAQGNVWAEYMPTTYQVEYMVFPRLLALSEVLWSPAAARSWPDFQERIQTHYGWLQQLNVNYYRPSWQVDIKARMDTARKAARIGISSEQYQPEIYYTLDGQLPTVKANRYRDSFEVKGTAVVKAGVFHNGTLQGTAVELPVDYHKAIGKKVIYNLPYSKGYPAQQEQTLVNGSRGSFTYGDGQWQGFEGKDMDVTIDMEQLQPLKSLALTFMQQTGPGVYIPAWVEVSVSTDGKQFTSAGKMDNDVPDTSPKLTFKTFHFNLPQQNIRFIRIKAKNAQHGFLFADEIIVY